MKILPNLLAIAWALLALAGALSDVLDAARHARPGGPRRPPASRSLPACEIVALLVALHCRRVEPRTRRDERGSRRWWMGWAPLFGSIVIGGFVALAVRLYRLL